MKFVSWAGGAAVPLITLSFRRVLLCAASYAAAQQGEKKVKSAVAFGSQEPARHIKLTTSKDWEENAVPLASSLILRYLKGSGRFKSLLYTQKSVFTPPGRRNGQRAKLETE